MSFFAAFVTINETDETKIYNFVDVRKCTDEDFMPFREVE